MVAKWQDYFTAQNLPRDMDMNRMSMDWFFRTYRDQRSQLQGQFKAAKNRAYWENIDEKARRINLVIPAAAPRQITSAEQYRAWVPAGIRKALAEGIGSHGSNRSPQTNPEFGVQRHFINARGRFGKYSQNPVIEWAEIARVTALDANSGPIVNTLAEANMAVAVDIAQQMPLAEVDKICNALEVQPEQFVEDNEINRRGIVAAYVANIATHEGRSIIDMRSATLGAGSIFSEFVKDVGDFVGDTARKIGAAIKDAAHFIMSLRGANGFAQFFIDASGMSLVFSALEQSGAALEAGTWAAFDDQALLMVVGETMRAAGTVIGAVGLLIPGFGTIAAIIGAVSIAVGEQIIQAQAKRLQRDQMHEVKDEIKERQKTISAQQALADESAKEARDYADLLAVPDANTPEQSNNKILPIAAAALLAAILIIGK